MTHPFFTPEITAEEISGCQSGVRRSLQYLFDDVFARGPAAQAAGPTCEPCSNDTPAPSDRTMREAPPSNAPKRPTLHLPPCAHSEADSTESANSLSK